eukprot:TRINITY_DN1779_c0_g1_i11.p1 TRINITY_DN1779_c0_g1~~TRINITY_DN1779_c0_g1_i11.p1  ORF type:complete len:172 (-),score=40.33 TRINITY_DN1779_c0_g1_i11:1138-1653(-)
MTHNEFIVATHKATGQEVAIKVMKKKDLVEKKMQGKVMREMCLVQKLKHPHLSRIYEVITDKKKVYMVMELVRGGELFDTIERRGKLSEKQARVYFQQIVSCLEYCHNHQIAHRDLKLENILLDEAGQHIKIVDFGLCNRMQDGRFLKTSCGSLNYAAPEVITGKYFPSSC